MDDQDPSLSDAELIVALEARIEEIERELAHGRETLHEAAMTSKSLAAEVDRVSTERDRLRRRRAVRVALEMSSRVRPLALAVRRLTATPRNAVRSARRKVRDARERSPRASPAAEAALTAAIRRDLAPATVLDGPLVSIVILNRDGREHLGRCLAAVARTAYRAVEIVLVDNGSSDGSADFAEAFDTPFPVKVVRNLENRSFSEANGQGVAIASGDLVCFLNNDVDPITEHWLGYMVETLTRTGAAAVGARLIYPRHRGGPRAGARFPDLSLQHAGVAFDRAEPIPIARVMGAGGDPMAATASVVEELPALTAACLLVDRKAFLAVDGFSPDYDYGIEDVDLCLRLRAAGGRLMYDGRAALWHHEFATRFADVERYKTRVAHNREVYVDTWGPRIFRAAILDAIAGGTAFSRDPFHVAIAVTSHDPDAGAGDWYTGHELGDALAALGWRVSYVERADDEWYRPDGSVEAMIVLLDSLDIRRLPRHIVTMAWVRGWRERWLARPWFDDFDLVFASSEGIASVVRDRSAKVATLLPIATNPERFGHAEPSPDLACDVLFVGSYWRQERAVVDALPALAERGYTVRVNGRGWDKVPSFAAIDHGFLAYDEVPRAYASARVVIDDAAVSTAATGSVNSRVFDALAAGALVLSNGAIGVRNLFDDAFPTWSDAASLVDLVDSVLHDATGAADRARTYRATVLEHHTYRHRAETVRGALTDWASSTRYGLRIGVPSWDDVERWGDYHVARALQRSLERAGHPTRVHFLPHWTTAIEAREDVTVHLFGLKEAPTRRGQVNLLWQISHPDLATPAMYERYDHVFVASDRFAARMASLVHTQVSSLHQATDPERFWPDPTGPKHELLFVANSRNVRRRIVEDLAGTRHDLAVYGRGWTPELLDPRFLKGEEIPNPDLRRYYSSADIVLNDHWDDMRVEGFISNRLYDALACGAFVISDHVEGIEEEFEGAVVTYRAADELESLIAQYLADPAERRRRAELGRQIVGERHTLERRAQVLRETADPIVASRPDRILTETPA